MSPAELAEMVDAYIEAALWAGSDWSPVEAGEDHNPRPWDDNYGPGDVSAAAREQIAAWCAGFATGETLADLEAVAGSWEQHGHDFYLTRNGHGAGFWDRGYGPAGDRLADAARIYGESDFYIGEDGNLEVDA